MNNIDLENYEQMLEEENKGKIGLSSTFSQDRAINPEKHDKEGGEYPRNAIREEIRAVILLCKEKGMKIIDIACAAGISEDYVECIMKGKYFPKRAEYQLRLLKKFDKIRREVLSQG